MRAITRRAASTIGLLAATGALMTAAAVPVTAAVDAPGGETRADVVVVPPGQRRAARHQHHVRQRALLPRQPERPVGPRADADAHEVPAEQRRRDVEHAHAFDRPHGGGQPRDLLRSVRRSSRPAREQQLQELHGRCERGDRTGHLVRLLELAGDQQHHQGSVHGQSPAVDGVLADGAGRERPPPPQTAPEPWVAYNKAGCSFGAFSSANMVLENNGDIPTVFGSPAPSPAPYFNNTSAFIGEAVHCGLGDAACEQADGAVTDTPPAANNPGTSTFKALFGHKFVLPVLTAHATAPSPYRVADAAGNLVDLDNREIADFQGHVGFPGFSPTASQTLAMLADMQEAGVPVTFGYIADVHERKDWSFQCTTADATGFGNALGPGDSCYEENLQRYDQAFAKFLDRLAKDGIGPNNTLFVIGAEENDHFAGANVGRADAPADPANCDGVTIPCRYAHNQVGEVQANIVGLLATERQQHDPVRRRAARCLDLRAQPQRQPQRRRPRTIRPSGSSSGTRPRSRRTTRTAASQARRS